MRLAGDVSAAPSRSAECSDPVVREGSLHPQREEVRLAGDFCAEVTLGLRLGCAEVALGLR